MIDVCGFNPYDSGMHNQSDLLDCSSKHDSLDQGAGMIAEERFQLRYTDDCLRASVEIAKLAVQEFWAEAANRENGRLKPLVAGAVGPAGDNLALWTGATDVETSPASPQN